uniref:Host translation inhibitor 5b n=2 Tax=Infectious bronchitis virus TaxID=11120 RepID=NS5B_IBVM|nr:RecName: Full=Host translation inhibitor 5b; Short=ns5b; AltName: Full=Accessory protein 5b [Avian infectious bronchitis virus (strain M41)]AAO33445.1 5b protein [Infectious bronchitis virus]ABI26429.1 5b [Infectious bronchitis virus]ADA83543.1 5b protein [Infectious bronchitis virus]ADA83553.1 5b protein [Infectious bronchitis virus]ADA83573.1 5b protein [Infectious bronchitis virus]
MNNSKDNPFCGAIARKARIYLREGLDCVYFLNKAGQAESCPACTSLVFQGKTCEEHKYNNNLLSWQAVRQLERQMPQLQSSN